MIKRVNYRFVVLDSGQQIPRAQAEGFKCSSSRPEDCPTYINQRRGGKTFISKQLGLF
jgi:hypothetical protein